MELSGHKKFILIFSVVITVTILVLASLIKKNFTITTTPVKEPLVALNAVEIPTNINEPLFGNPGAPLTLVAYLDFGSNSERKLYQKISGLISSHPQDVRLVFKHAPYSNFLLTSTHEKTHLALLCAQEQNKFWPFLNTVAKISTLWRTKQLTDAATTAGLNLEKFSDCLKNPLTKTNLDSITAESKLLASTAPTIYANNKKLTLPKDVDIVELLLSFIKPE